MKFRDMELDFDIYEADTADEYEKAIKDLQKIAAKVPGESLGNAIRRQCNAVFDFFDYLFGEGFHKEIFGKKTNLLECIEAFKEFNDIVNEQKKSLESRAQEISAQKATPNRAMRRAMARDNESLN